MWRLLRDSSPETATVPFFASLGPQLRSGLRALGLGNRRLSCSGPPVPTASLQHELQRTTVQGQFNVLVKRPGNQESKQRQQDRGRPWAVLDTVGRQFPRHREHEAVDQI